MNSQVVEFKQWMKVAIPLGIIAFAVVGVYVIWLSVSAFEQSLQEGLMLALSGVFCLYMVYSVFPLARYLSHRVVVSNNGLSIEGPRSRKFYGWENLGKVKDHSIFEVVKIYDTSGRLVYAVDYRAPNAGLLRVMLGEFLGA